MSSQGDSLRSEVGKLTVTVRANRGKGHSRALRAQGKVPGVCYGATAAGRVDPLPVTVDIKALRAALDRAIAADPSGRLRDAMEFAAEMEEGPARPPAPTPERAKEDTRLPP